MEHIEKQSYLNMIMYGNIQMQSQVNVMGYRNKETLSRLKNDNTCIYK